jgi:dTDP-4-dehydrorhamnose 3,5-epimerase
VAIDMRSTSSTYKQFVFAELSGENHMQLFIPQRFAHGFIVTSESAIVQYKTDAFYHPESEVGIHPYDPTLNIPWPVQKSDHLLSGKDQKLPFLSSMNLGL